MRGVLEGRNDVVVDVVTCGIGEVDAAMVTTSILMQRLPQLVLSVGCSGGHSKHLKEGDVIVSTAVVPTAYKMIRHNGESHHIGLRRNISDPPLRELPIDSALTEAAMAGAALSTLPSWCVLVLTTFLQCYCIGFRPSTSTTRPIVYRGKIGSSDIWTQWPKEIERQHNELGTLCEEMESFGCGRVCQEFGVPFIAIKDVANNELNKRLAADTETGVGESLVAAEMGRRAALIALAMLQDHARLSLF